MSDAYMIVAGAIACLGLSAAGSAFGTGFAASAAVGAWKKCYAANKPAPFILLGLGDHVAVDAAYRGQAHEHAGAVLVAEPPLYVELLVAGWVDPIRRADRIGLRLEPCGVDHLFSRSYAEAQCTQVSAMSVNTIVKMATVSTIPSAER